MRRLLDNVIVWLVAYYIALPAFFLALLQLFPWIGEAVITERSRGVGTALSGQSADAVAFGLEAASMTGADALATITLTLLGALSLSLPVALVYQWTREPEEYRRDFSRALVALPIAVALSVFLVKNSLALAFSLAGIVAAIRWQAALTETMDGVFMFVVIGIGLAAGAQLLMVALVASVIFNALILSLARTGHAEHPLRLAGFTLVRDSPPAEAGTPRGVDIRVEVSDRIRAEAHVENVLNACAKQWHRSRVTPLANGYALLEYEATLKKRCAPEELRRNIADARISEIGDVAVTSDSPASP